MNCVSPEWSSTPSLSVITKASPAASTREALDLVEHIAAGCCEFGQEIMQVLLGDDRQARRRAGPVTRLASETKVSFLILASRPTWLSRSITMKPPGTAVISDRPTQPFSGLVERIVHGAPALVRGLVGEKLGHALGIVLPFALHGEPDGLIGARAGDGDALEAEARGIGGERFGDGDLLGDRAGGIDLDQHRLGLVLLALGIAFRGEPEAAIRGERDAFEIEKLRRLRRPWSRSSLPVMTAGFLVASMVRMRPCAKTLSVTA